MTMSLQTLVVLVFMLLDADALSTPVRRVVMKFGGSSVRDAERIMEVSKLVKQQIADGLQPQLVCSAMGKTTNNLLAAADRALTTRNVHPCQSGDCTTCRVGC